jgi:ubiquinone/menaquinone biosynthesis C-methylase UbiE
MPPARRKKKVLLERFVNMIALSGGKYKAYAALGFAVVMLFFAKPEFRVDLSSMNSVTKETIAAENLVTTVWGKILNKIYMMSEAENVRELQRVGDRLSVMLDQEVASGMLRSVFIPSMIFPGEERGKQNFNSWKKFWNENRKVEFKANIQRISSDTGFSDNAFEPFLNMIDQNEYRETEIPEKFFSLLGISRTHDKSGLVLFSSLTPGGSYQADPFFDRFHASGNTKIFDPNLFSERLGKLLSHTFLKMLVIISFSLLILLLPYFMDWKLTVVSLIPVIFSFVCTLGTMKLIHHPLDIPSLMLSIVILGIGSDYSLYLVRSSQRYMDESHPFQSQVRLAIFLASISAAIGFGALGLSEHALLKSMGLIPLLGIGYTLIGTFMILPPLLKYFFLPVSLEESAGNLVPGSRVHRNRVMRRYQFMETYPRMFAWFKMKLDPMFHDFASFVKSPETIIDIGSGFGIPIVWLLELFPHARVYGIEPDIARVRVASRAIGDRGSIVQGSAPDVPDVPVLADVAVMLDMIHYLTDDELKLTLKKLAGLLRPEGRLIIRVTIPLKEPAPWYRQVEKIRLKIWGIRSYYRDPDEIEVLISQAGFKISKIQPSGQNREETWFMAGLIMDWREKA